MADPAFTALKNLFQDTPRPIHLHEPVFDQTEKDYVLDCIETGWVSSAGAYVERFSKDLSTYTGAHAIPTTNGTSALHLCLKLAGVEAGEEVLTPSLTFVATTNAIHYCGALPHFLSNDSSNFYYDIKKLREYINSNFKAQDIGIQNITTNRIIKALLVTHIFGFPAPMDEIKELCEEYNLTLIEDAAESLGSFYKDAHTGTQGTLAALSFNGNKIMTTGGGGAILTTDPELARQAEHLSTTARIADPYAHSHDEIGYNYRMPNINAALGCAQLEKLPQFLEKKRRLAMNYQHAFEDIETATFVTEEAGTQSNYWLNSLILPTEQARNNLLDALKAEDIHCRGMWKPMHLLPMYKDCPRMDCTNAENLASRTLNLPSSSFLIDQIKDSA